jgi:putative endonuclease
VNLKSLGASTERSGEGAHKVRAQRAERASQCPEPVEGLAFVYVLHCRNGTFYVGHSHDVTKRLEAHKAGVGARHTQLLKHFILIYYEGPMASDFAIRREHQIKKWSRAKKIALIKGDLNALKSLSKSRDA